MNYENRNIRSQKFLAGILAVTGLLGAIPGSAFGQAPPPPPPPAFPPATLDQLVSRIALYPDPLLSQILAAATFPDQIQPAAGWSDQHHYLQGDQLAAAISGDQLPWDPSVQALLPFPSVLEMMASDMRWTTDIGNAFLSQQPEVMDAVQRMRHSAYNYGYLRSGPQLIVTPGPYIAIAPVNPAFMVVPYYDPLVVFRAPRAGFAVGGAIRFNFGISLGVAFRPWGWGVAGFNRFDWGAHRVFVNNAYWGRTWGNRGVYVHPGYSGFRHFAPANRMETHQLEQRSAREREAPRQGRERVEEHRR